MEPNFIIAVVVPFVLSAVFVVRERADLARNKIILLGTGFASALLAVPPAQQWMAVAWHEEGSLYVPALFTPAYLVWGRFTLPSAYTAFSGSFFTLLFADLAHAGWLGVIDVERVERALSGIGGAGLSDGLILVPLASVALVLLVRRILASGKPLRFMVGRNWFS